MSQSSKPQTYIFSDSSDDDGEAVKGIGGSEGITMKTPVSINDTLKLLDRLDCLFPKLIQQAKAKRMTTLPKANKVSPDDVGTGSTGCRPTLKDTISRRRYKCPYCLVSFTLANSLIQHLELHHKGESEFIDVELKNGRMLPKCSKTFWKKWAARRHIRVHAAGKKSCKRNICGNISVRK